MKILLINKYHYRKGGADAVYFNTARLLEKNGHQVFYFSAKYEENVACPTERFFAEGNDYRKISLGKKLAGITSFFYNRDAYTKLLQLLEEIKPDIAHIHLFMGSGLSSSILLALKRKKIPLVHTVHDHRLICPAYLFMDGNNELCEKCMDGFYLRCLFKRCSEKSLSQSAMLSFDAYFRKYIIKPIRHIDRFIFVSNFIKDKHIEFDLNYEPKADMLYNFNPELNAIVPSETKGKYFLYYGRISREKGILTLIESALKAEIMLKIVGAGPLLGQYADQYCDKIEFLGFKNGEDLWSLIRHASFIIVPSICYENNPMTIVEAYSFGKPVIGSRIGGIPEIVEESKTGYLFTPGNKSELEQLLQKADNLPDDEYREMSRNARAFAQKQFNPDLHYNKLIGIYESAVDLKN